MPPRLRRCCCGWLLLEGAPAFVAPPPISTTPANVPAAENPADSGTPARPFGLPGPNGVGAVAARGALRTGEEEVTAFATSGAPPPPPVTVVLSCGGAGDGRMVPPLAPPGTAASFTGAGFGCKGGPIIGLAGSAERGPAEKPSAGGCAVIGRSSSPSGDATRDVSKETAVGIGEAAGGRCVGNIDDATIAAATAAPTGTSTEMLDDERVRDIATEGASDAPPPLGGGSPRLPPEEGAERRFSADSSGVGLSGPGRRSGAIDEAIGNQKGGKKFTRRAVRSLCFPLRRS